MKTRRIHQRGDALVVVLILVLMLGALGAGVLSLQMGASRHVASRTDAERAYQMAEAGAAWTLAEVRENHGRLPPQIPFMRQPHPSGSFRVWIEEGALNGRDDDGDGLQDEADEEPLRVLLSTGESNGVQRTLEVVLRVRVEAPSFTSALAMNADPPLVELDGNAFRIDGHDHRLNGTRDPTGDHRAGLSVVIPTSEVLPQIDPHQADQVLGTGGVPSIDQVEPVDITGLLEFASIAPSLELAPGTYSSLELGEPTSQGVETLYVNGDLTLSGGAYGAGVLAVAGDLHVSGGLTWTGIVIVGGNVSFTGGGANNKVIGAFVIGGDATVGGTVDLLYSSTAVELAKLELTYLGVSSWRQVGNPAP
jgi:hypothetical protein